MNQKINFAAVGDIFALRRLCQNDETLRPFHDLFHRADVSFANLETPVHRYEADVYPSRSSGGDWAVTSPEVLQDLMCLGINLIGAANNHSLDWSQTGVVRTIDYLNRAGAIYAGIGVNMAGAAAPSYIETPGGRVALISFNTSFESWHMAGEQRRDLHGRPGIFGVEHLKTVAVTPEEMQQLERFHSYTAGEDDGWKTVDDTPVFFLGGTGYVTDEGTSGSVSTKVRRHSLDLLERSISEARRQADIVLISAHSHERFGTNPHEPAAFQDELAHFCIEKGAQIYIGHGPHVLRGAELYRDGLILHGLGNFFYQCELIPKSPTEFYSKFAPFGPDACTMDVYDYRVNNGGILGETNPDYFISAAAEFSFRQGRLEELIFHPVSLRFNDHRSTKGTPVIAEDAEADMIFSQIEECSKRYHTRFVRENNRLRLVL